MTILVSVLSIILYIFYVFILVLVAGGVLLIALLTGIKNLFKFHKNH